MTLLEFLNEYDKSLLLALLEHLQLVGTSMLIATLAGVPLSVVAWRHRRTGRAVIALASLIQTVPSIALFGLMIPLLALVNRGIGAVPAVIALVLYAILPIVRNGVAALKGLPPDVLEAARAMGMTNRQLLLRVALPLSAAGILSGIRIATTVGIGVAAVAAYIGAGGLGLFISRGIATTFNTMTLAGALGVAMLALVLEFVFELLERLLSPPGSNLQRRRSQTG